MAILGLRRRWEDPSAPRAGVGRAGTSALTVERAGRGMPLRRNGGVIASAACAVMSSCALTSATLAAMTRSAGSCVAW